MPDSIPEGPMGQTTVKLTPADHGRRMSLADFEHAEATGGKLYELGRGVVVVSDVPKRRHMLIVQAIREQLTVHRLGHRGQINTIAGSGECKILLTEFDSERHPDVA